MFGKEINSELYNNKIWFDNLNKNINYIRKKFVYYNSFNNILDYHQILFTPLKIYFDKVFECEFLYGSNVLEIVNNFIELYDDDGNLFKTIKNKKSIVDEYDFKVLCKINTNFYSVKDIYFLKFCYLLNIAVFKEIFNIKNNHIYTDKNIIKYNLEKYLY